MRLHEDPELLIVPRDHVQHKQPGAVGHRLNEGPCLATLSCSSSPIPLPCHFTSRALLATNRVTRLSGSHAVQPCHARAQWQAAPLPSHAFLQRSPPPESVLPRQSPTFAVPKSAYGDLYSAFLSGGASRPTALAVPRPALPIAQRLGVGSTLSPNQGLSGAAVRDPAPTPASSLRRKVSRFAHPLGVDTTINTGPILGLGSEQMIERIMSNAVALQWGSIKTTSLNSYKTAWNHWIPFTRALGTDPLLQTVPPQYLAQPVYLLSFVETVVLGFFMYLRYDRRVIPTTIKQYMSAVRFVLSNCGVDANSTKSVTIQRVFSGINLEWQLEPGNSLAERQHLAFSPDMIRVTGETLDMSSDWDFALLTAVYTGFQFLTRVGELVYAGPDQDHFIKGSSVAFIVQTPQGGKQCIPSNEAYRYSIGNVVSVIVDVKDSKNDPSGVGFRYELPKRSPESLTHIDAFDICALLFECATRLRPAPDESFFKTTVGAEWQIKDSDISAFIKKGAVLVGLDPKRFVTHSLRIAGASALAALDAPAWYIRKAGRWTSDQYLQYIRMASSSFAVFMGRMHSAISVEDTFRWMPSLSTMPFQGAIIAPN